MYQLMIALAGPILWAGHFSLMYAAQTLACMGFFGLSRDIFGLAASLLTAFTVCALLATIGYQVLASRGRQQSALASSLDFLRELHIMLAGLALLAAVWGSFPAVALSVRHCP